jgi:hypothetical protein
MSINHSGRSTLGTTGTGQITASTTARLFHGVPKSTFNHAAYLAFSAKCLSTFYL